MNKVISSSLFFKDVKLNHVHTRDDFSTQAHDHLVNLKLTFNSKGDPSSSGDYVALPVTNKTIKAVFDKITDITKDTLQATFEQFAVLILDGVNEAIPDIRKNLNLKSDFYLSGVIISVEEGKAEPVSGVVHPQIMRIDYAANTLL